MTGADRQWQLNRRNFEGCWQGPSHWYLRGEPQSGPGPAAELDWTRPSRVIEHTRYAIHFSDADTGVWDGSGLLLAPGGKRRLELSRATYNRGGSCWQFPGAGGQSSLRVDAEAPRFGHEINLFQGRSRSMLVLLWSREAGGGEGRGDGPGCWRLASVAAVAFRCSLSEPAEPPRPPLAVDGLLAAVEGWRGTLETLQPGCWPEQDPAPAPTAPFRAARFAAAGPCVSLADRLVFAAPEWLPAGAFRIEAGCLLTPQRFHGISLVFDGQQRLSAVELRRFRPHRSAQLSPDGDSATAG
jgi:hypothetical protein